MRNRVKELRTNLKMKQAVLAEASGIGRSTLSEIENNKHLPSVDIAIKISRVLGYPVEEVWIL